MNVLLNDRQTLFGKHQDINQRIICDVVRIMTEVHEKNIEDGDCDNDTYNSKAGDLGPESIKYFSRSGQHFIAVGNEVSGTTPVFQIEF